MVMRPQGSRTCPHGANVQADRRSAAYPSAMGCLRLAERPLGPIRLYVTPKGGSSRAPPAGVEKTGPARSTYCCPLARDASLLARLDALVPARRFRRVCR
jgi:hypothetical protein